MGLEWLLLTLDAEKKAGGGEPLRMAEMGVACGPIGLHLLLRFPEMEYLGADPTIRPEVYGAYRRFGPRASLMRRLVRTCTARWTEMRSSIWFLLTGLIHTRTCAMTSSSGSQRFVEEGSSRATT